VVPLAWRLGLNLRVALDEEYRLGDGRRVTSTGKSSWILAHDQYNPPRVVIGSGTFCAKPDPTRFHAPGRGIPRIQDKPDLIRYLSPSTSSSRLSTTEVMPGTVLATSFA